MIRASHMKPARDGATRRLVHPRRTGLTGENLAAPRAMVPSLDRPCGPCLSDPQGTGLAVVISQVPDCSARARDWLAAHAKTPFDMVEASALNLCLYTSARVRWISGAPGAASAAISAR